MDAELERILDAGYPGDLTTRSLDDVRAMRAECQQVEAGLSYIRRLVQGRLDIVRAEVDRRATGGDPTAIGELLGQLPDILAEHTRTPGVGRLPQIMAPGDVRGSLTDELDAIVSAGHLGTLADASEADLATVDEALTALEHKVSERRHEVFDRLDALQAEVTRRYKSGEASVETLLQ
jgi:hypothetical protein